MRKIAVLITRLVILITLLSGCEKDLDVQVSLRPSSPNIILVMTDDQGYGDLGMHNNPIVQTPQIDQLGAESHRFTNFHVDPTCSPTRAALMSGKDSMRAGVWHTVMGRHMLSDRHDTLPEILRDAGYDTAMFGKWHLGDNYPFRPQDQGFDHVLIHGGGGIGQAPDYWANDQFDDTYFLNGQTKMYEGFGTDIWFDGAIDYIQRKADDAKPFFVYLSTNAPHIPWRVPEEYVAPYLDLGLEEDMAKFYAMITNLDDNMGRLRTAIRDANIEENTVFIFMTDNGSVLAARSNGEPASWVSDKTELVIGKEVETLNNYMRGGKASTYDGGHRVPFFISWPAGNLGKATDIEDLTAHVDILPTLLDLAGIELADIDTDGISLVSALKLGAELPDRTMVVTNQRVLHPNPDRPYAVMQGNWRYVHAQQNGGVELFNLVTDPGQTNNIIDQYPERADYMAKAYDAWWFKVTSAGNPTTRPIIGADAENPMRISAMDWLAPNTEQVPWWPGFGNDKWANGWLGKEGDFRLSPWALKVAVTGDYRITLFLHDEPAQKVIPHKFAHLELNGEVKTQVLDDGGVSSTFDVSLKAGELDVRAWFDDGEDASGQLLAAFYMYLERI
jgi:arylsulfatase A-like enzyme